MINGKINGLKPSDIKALERIYRRRIPADSLISDELARYLTEQSAQIGRQIGLIINRAGEVLHVIVGDHREILIPDLSGYALGRSGLRGLRCVHTHLKQELLDHEEFQAWTKDLWSSLQRGFGDATRHADSDVRHRIEDAIVSVANRLAEDAELQHKVDTWIESIVVYLAEQGRTEIGGLIANTVEGWDPNETADRIELQVGRDLQFIRINGTLVGGLVGLLIHTFSELFF